MRKGCQSDDEIDGTISSKNLNYGRCGQYTGTLRILNQEVNMILEKDSGYKNVYWFMFTDGGARCPHDELEVLKKTFEANPKRWSHELSGSRSKLIPLIITN